MSVSRTILEAGAPLSASLLWKLQRRFFAAQGLRAWSAGIVPHYVSSNPFLARSYGRIVDGFLADSRQRIDPREPVYVIELGAGAGRLGYHFLKQLPRHGFAADLRLRYVLTDFLEDNVAELGRHPWLAPLAADGRLDFALFDAEAPGDLKLLHGGEVLTPDALANPLVVVANYFFDGLPQDVFLIAGGEVRAALATLSVPAEGSESPAGNAEDDPELLSRIQLEYTYGPPGEPLYASEPDLARILAGYREDLDATHVTFPCAALRCLRFFRELSGDRLLVLSADKGHAHADTLLDRGAPGFARHGSISMSVNYHAIARSFLDAGGAAFTPRRRQSSLRICAFVSGQAAETLPVTRHAFEESIELQGPDDFFSLKKGLEKTHESLSLDEILALLRLSGWDAHIFWGMSQRLLALSPGADAGTRQELSWMARRVWDMYLPIGEERDLAFQLALLLAAIDFYPEALEMFAWSLRLQGRHAETFYNMALCHARLRQLRPALAALDEALELKPGYPEARSLRIKLQGELGDETV